MGIQYATSGTGATMPRMRLRWLLVATGTWLLVVAVHPAPLTARVLLGAPLVLVPAHIGGLLRFGAAPGRSTRIERLAGYLAIAAALPLLPAFALAPGLPAAALSLPWLVVGATAGVAGISALTRQVRRRLLDPTVIGGAGALALLATASAFLVSDRLGVYPFGFSAEIIRLTAVHFHFAGFGLLGVAVVSTSNSPNLTRIAVLGLITGIPVTAAGFFGIPLASWIGSCIVGVGGIAAAMTLLPTARGARRAPRLMLLAAAGALFVGLPLGVGWATAELLRLPCLDLEAMVRTHGALNASGVLIGALALAGMDRRWTW